MNEQPVSAPTTLDAPAVRHVQHLLTDLRRTEANVRDILAVGNLAAARWQAAEMAQQAAALVEVLDSWPLSLSVKPVEEGCPACGGPLSEYNSASLYGSAFQLCAACGHERPVPKVGFYAGPEQMGAYVFADEVLPSPQGVLAVIAAHSPAAAARHFEHLMRRTLTLTREPTEPSPHWYFLCWDGPLGTSAPRPIQARWLRPLASGEDIGQRLVADEAIQAP
ncbi:hypothetical protein GCM10022631_15700 [Deinococcus rubellus]|uniref:hypothetical protein n=1 Tax=Deinococcus rubellus TaxID=1889240 RepID=UPI0031EA0255